MFLPKYLSPGTEEKLFRDLDQFPNNIDSRMYSDISGDLDSVAQGDVVDGLIVVRIPETKMKPAVCMVLSNTCDLSPDNPRFIPSNVIYVPILSFAKYKQMLTSNPDISTERIQGHLSSIKEQKCTQALFLPKCEDRIEESLVFFDRVCSCSIGFLERIVASNGRLLSLSQYGFYLLLYKLSIFICRMNENLDRKY